ATYGGFEMRSRTVYATLSRRMLLRSLALAAAAPLLEACAAGPTAARPTEAPAPAAANPAPATQPTAAPAAAAQPAPAVASPAPASRPAIVGAMRAPEPNPKRGGTLRMAIGVTTPHFDIHQGGTSAVLCQLYSNLVRLNLADGLREIIPDLAEKW